MDAKTESEAGPANVERSKALGLYERMLTVRRFELAVEGAHRQGRLYGTFHSSLGQEAVAVGACSALEVSDVITSTHRGHGHVIGKGGDPKKMCAELWGRSTGYCGGWGGSMHLADMERGVIGQNGVVGASIFLAAGAALAFQQKGSRRVALSFAGDGAVGLGVFSETLNLAALWSLPIVFVIENNGFAHSMASTWIEAKGASVTDRAKTYGMPAVTVDGRDVVAVYEAVDECVTRARGGNGPSLVEATCYRWRGHNFGDADQFYRDRATVEKAMKDDPLARFLQVLEQWGLDDECREIEGKVAKVIEEAIEFAEQSPVPSGDAVKNSLSG